MLVVKDDQQYRYDINDDYIYETFPINMGSGEYKVKVGENIEDNRYAIILTVSFSVTLVDDVIPFLYPNQVIDFDIDSSAVSLSFGLTEDAKSQLERVYVIYHYIIDNIDYDFGKLEAARSSYILPIIDETLASKKGICFDYASLMSAMLRVQQIPTKVITGYVDDGYHSWVEVYIDGEGGSLTGTETITVEEGTLFSEVVIPTPVAAEGYEFDAWTPVLPADATEITEDLSFVANFNEVEEIVEPDTPETPEVAAEGCWIHWLMLLLTLVYGLYEGIRLNKKEEYAQKGGNK